MSKVPVEFLARQPIGDLSRGERRRLRRAGLQTARGQRQALRAARRRYGGGQPETPVSPPRYSYQMNGQKAVVFDEERQVFVKVFGGITAISRARAMANKLNRQEENRAEG